MQWDSVRYWRVSALVLERFFWHLWRYLQRPLQVLPLRLVPLQQPEQLLQQWGQQRPRLEQLWQVQP